MTCVADLTSAAGQEIVAGTAVYRLPTAIPACATPPCNNNTLELVWNASSVNSNLLASEGLCAVADIWGADTSSPPGPANLPDGSPEVILVGGSNVMILSGASGALIHQEALGGEDRGGAPNVDDFDGDGLLEIATALSDFYTVVDLQEPAASCPVWPDALANDFSQANPNPARTPGDVSCVSDADCNEGAVCNTQLSQCVCLHNGWQRQSDDSSSRLTSSSVFDFNGDGAAEVLYNDECEFRIFDGISGDVHFAAVSRGRTWTENPVVADVDNDGNAEVVTFSNTEPGDRCDEDGQNPIGPNGIRVWGDPQDTWVPARRIWNQQSYHVTNVTEAGTIPLHPPDSWDTLNGRTYNTYRSQPRTFGVAPDLTVTGVGIFSPDAQCGELSSTINITYEVTNQGDLRVGPGVQLSFFGIWADGEEALLTAGGSALTATLADGIDPGRSLIETVTFELANQTGRDALPEQVRVVVDSGGEAGSSFGAERECDEENNSRTAVIEAGEMLADLSILLGEASVNCDTRLAQVAVTVVNSGVVTASGVVVHLYAGNPVQGGTRMATHVLDETIAPGASVSLVLDAADFPQNREVTIWGFVDPEGAIAECNEADNIEEADNAIICHEVIIK